jgi:hypothetical protein
MYDQKPTTSLMEDLEVLGLVKQPKNDRQLNEMGGDMEPDDTGAYGQPEGGAPPAQPAPEDEAPPPAPQAKVPGVPAAPPFPSKGAPVDDQGEKDMYGEPQDTYSDYSMAGGDEEMAAYESAWNVVKQYYALNERKEKLSEDDYKTVVNAMSFIIETQGKYLKLEPDHDPDELPGGNNPAWAGNAENNPNEKVDGTGAMRKLKGWRYHDASPRPSEKAESLSGLVGELKALTQQTESDDEMQSLGTKIIEGFEAIRDTADEVAQGLANELRESNEKVTEGHPRVRLGKYFEGVGADARLLLRAISERETTDVDDAIEDLNSLARDLKRGLAQL